MAINLEEHVVFIDRLQMDMVPLSIAKQAVQEAAENNPALDEAIKTISDAMNNINTTISKND